MAKKKIMYPTVRISNFAEDLAKKLNLLKIRIVSKKISKDDAITEGYKLLEAHHKRITLQMNRWFTQNRLPPVETESHPSFDRHIENAKKSWKSIVNDL